MEKPETAASSEVLAAMCHLLSIVLGRVPNAILRAKFGAGSAVLCGIVESKQVGGAGGQQPCAGRAGRAGRQQTCAGLASTQAVAMCEHAGSS